MGVADLGFMHPLFELATALSDDHDDGAELALGLGEIHPESTLARDDADLDGYWVSAVVTHGLTAAIDHVVTLRDLIQRERATVTVNAPWTLLRGTLEPASTALWVLAGATRPTRRARALRVWHHDFSERQNWERDAGVRVPGGGKPGAERAADVRRLAKQLGVPPNKVATRLAHADTVAAAGEAAGWSRGAACAKWREASGFAHGRTWPTLQLTTPRDVQRIKGGYGMHLALDESRLKALAELTHDVLATALVEYARLAAQDRDPSASPQT